MKTVLISCALSLASASSTAQGQSRLDIFDFTHNGIAYVGLRASAWEDVVAKRITSNDLNRMRARSVLELHDQVAAADSMAASFRRDAEGYKDRLAAQIAETDKAKGQRDRANRKVRNRTPWARAAQGVVGFVVLAGIGKGVNAIAPGTIPLL